MKQIFNPIFPLSEYIPDGEPHVFDDRVYLYGSHDKEGGEEYCMLDYVCYSAPVEDLTDWRYEGVIYKSSQDPAYGENRKYMYAPDVVRGNDGRFYLYYCLLGDHYISVAVCDTPAGNYEYYGDVKNADGSLLRRFVPGDPAVINDNGVIRLYYGWSLALPDEQAGMLKCAPPEMEEQLINAQMMLFNKTREEVVSEPEGVMGANHVELSGDMLTAITQPVRIIPGQLKAFGTSFEGHAFYEASSIRKVGDTYYFIYSPQKNNQLCYATSKYPDKDFVYGGVIISNCDVELNGRKQSDALNLAGTNHGSIEKINGQWYVFYHRLTHGSDYSRQACAEKIEILPDGSISQVEVTTQGLNGKPLVASGTYPAAIACNISNGYMPNIQFEQIKINHSVPRVTYDGFERFITGISDGTIIGYKYFEFKETTKLSLMLKGDDGIVVIKDEKKELGRICLSASDSWSEYQLFINTTGKHPLYFEFKGEGKYDFLSLSFQ